MLANKLTFLTLLTFLAIHATHCHTFFSSIDNGGGVLCALKMSKTSKKSSAGAIEKTLICTNLVHFENDDYLCKAAQNLQETTALIKVGFEYVTELEGVKIFKKRK